MNKTVKLIIVLILLIFAFVAGVKYSNSVKSHAGWLFEAKEEEVELPDLSDENNAEATGENDQNAPNIDGGATTETPAAEAPQEATPATPTETPVKK